MTLKFPLRFNKSISYKIGGFMLLLCLIIPTFTMLFTLPTSKAADPTLLTKKWTGYIGGGGEDVVTADVLPGFPGEEIFHAGGTQAPNSGGRVSCLNGQTGVAIWTKTIANVGDTCQIQMVDMDNDDDLEIVVPLQHPAGLYILHAENGNVMYSDSSLGLDSVPNDDGRIDSGPVAGDTDNDGYPDLFVGVMGYEKMPTTGKIIHFEWNPATDTVVERGRVQVWHPCAGGLALGDTDNDGTFELYMNERDVYFGDGAWGRGTISFWAENLTVRWQLYDWGASSNKPMLADVNKDGIQEVVITDLSAGVAVLNSTNGRPIKNADGLTLKQTNIPDRHNHYQSSIYDIDGDGNLEILSGDGFEGDWDLVTVFDLYSWTLDAAINTTIIGGRSWKGPTVGEVTGDGQMDILVTTFDHLDNADNGTLQVYDKNYDLEYSYVGFKHRAIDTVVQDVDQDGLNEVLVLTQGGIIYCFDTLAATSSPRARSEVQGYSESRNFASEYVPYHRPWPDVSSPNPLPNTYNVSTALDTISFKLNHVLGQTMDYTVTTTPNIGSVSETGVGNGVVSVSISGLAPSTYYQWQVTATDQSEHTTTQNYGFYTAPYFTNSAPTQSNPTISNGSIKEDLVCQNQSTSDLDGNAVNNVYNWYKNGDSLTNLNLPLDIQLDADAVYSGLAVARDYSGKNNTAQVFGATYTEGVVGAGLSFDGRDFITVTEAYRGSLDGNGTWSGISIEFWIKAPTVGTPEKVLWKGDPYNTKNITSYNIDVQNTGAVLNFTWTVASKNNTYFIYNDYTTAVSDWHHVVCTYKSGSGMKIYVDGTASSINSSSLITGNVNATLGPLQIAFNKPGRTSTDFVGSLDEIKIYPSELTATMVNQRYLETKDGSSNSSTIPASDLKAGEQWSCSVTPNDGLTDGSNLISATVLAFTPPNTPPLATDLGITPASPKNDDNLVAHYTYTDAEGDPEGNSVVAWYRNGVFNTTGQTLPASYTSVGELWTIKVTPNDGISNGTTTGPSNPVTIVNTAPVVSNLQISPALPTHDKDLVAQYTYSDAEGDPEVNSVVSWYRNGSFVTTGKTLNALYTSIGDVWTFKVTPNDGFDNGTTAGPSNPVTITNTPPVATDLSITPSTPNTNENLVAQYTYSDAEGDPEVNSVVSWYRNGLFVTTGKTLNADLTSTGDIWTYTVKPNDGFVNGTVAGPSNPETIIDTQGATEPTPTPTPTSTSPTPTPTSTPTTAAPTATPTTSNPTSTPKPTVKPTQQPTPTPTIPEGLIVALFVVLAATLTLAIIAKKTELKKPLTIHHNYH